MSEPVDAAAILAEPVFAGGETKPFAQLTLAEVEARAQELRDVSGWGPTAKVRSVAMEWGSWPARWPSRGRSAWATWTPRSSCSARRSSGSCRPEAACSEPRRRAAYP